MSIICFFACLIIIGVLIFFISLANIWANISALSGAAVYVGAINSTLQSIIA